MSSSHPHTAHLSQEELPHSGTVVVFDTEYTAWEGSAQRQWSGPGEEIEIVQIGAVKVDANDWREVDAFSVLVKPVINPVLSDYFVALTGIQQADVDAQGQSLPEALEAFVQFTAGATWVLSNGDDRRVVAKNCALISLPCPLSLSNYRNLHPLLPQLLNGNDKPISSYKLVDFVGPQGDEVAHQAISDARTIARTLRMLREQSRI